MNSLLHGESTLVNEVTNICKQGFWILIQQKEYFVPFAEYPEFRKATVEQILNFKMFSPTQLHWEAIDCDIELDALDKPENSPLKFNT